ncbi:hypothetical protein [Ramlibacter sp.]|uniref:hypothetical protein n=1 Tax=Ramlibacter sp. TaxID=1917967 RepID=UPI003D146DDC
MKNAKLRSTVAALMLLAPAAALIGTPAAAAPKAAAAARALEIHTLQVNADEGLRPGSDLQFALEATPRSAATVTLGKTNIVVALKETSAGMYRGTYTVRSRDRIDPTATIAAKVVSGKRSAVHSFSYPASFQALAMGVAPATPVAVAPPPVLKIEEFHARPVGRIEPGRELNFRINGAPGASASFDIPGVVSNVAMRETRPGHYEGSYTIRQRDNPDAFNGATATLRQGSQVATARLVRPLARGDTEAPTLGNLLPRPGDIVPNGAAVSGTFDDAGGRGVDPSTVRILISGRDVTGVARVTPQDFSYRINLPPGRHLAEVTAVDRAGNAVNKTWSFDVGAPGPVISYGGGIPIIVR